MRNCFQFRNFSTIVLNMARFEQKYVLQRKSDLMFFLVDLQEMMNRLGFVERTYNVESLYFDFPDLSLLRQKEAGEWAKNKFRLRGYPETGDLFWERKSKLNQLSYKVRTPVASRGLIDFEKDILSKTGLVKTCLVRYSRRVWSKEGSTLRFNIDSQINGYNYFKASDFALTNVVAEFKYEDNFEVEYSLLTAALDRHAMISEPFSKYFLGMSHEFF